MTRAALLLALCLLATAAAGPRPAGTASGRSATAREVAYRFAPVFLQKTSTRTGDGKQFEDYFVRLDFDGNASGFNNWEGLSGCASQPCDLRAVVYCAVRETAKNYYLHYAYFHPRDPKRFFGHENDLEGALVVVKKPGGSALPDGTHIATVQVQAHNRWDYWEPGEFCMLEQGRDLAQVACEAPLAAKRTHVVLVSQVGRGWWLRQGHGTEIPDRVDFDEAEFIVYAPWTKEGKPPAHLGEAGVPSPPAPGPVPYALVGWSGDADGDGKLEAADMFGNGRAAGLWDRRRDLRIFGKTDPLGHALQGDDGCKANGPWGWTGGMIPAGAFFMAPDNGLAFANLRAHGVIEAQPATFESDPYGKDSNLGLFPPNPVPLACDCPAMQTAFVKGNLSPDPLPQGPPCTKPKAAPTASEGLGTEGTFTSCDALREWVPEEANERVESIREAGRCVGLHIPGDVLLRWPPSADDLADGQGRALRLRSGGQVLGVKVTARAVREPVRLGGFFLQAGRSYDESLADVSWFRPQVISRARTPLTFLLSESRRAVANVPASAVVILPDISTELESGKPFRAPAGQPWEVSSIELLGAPDLNMR